MILSLSWQSQGGEIVWWVWVVKVAIVPPLQVHTYFNAHAAAQNKRLPFLASSAPEHLTPVSAKQNRHACLLENIPID